ncbi:GtrA family protein [Bacillus thermocopriae]|uniref:GtrA family protein n=1 Tax=Neobacillus thermocopriae TaxID=1215031 RepID=A0A6B3TLB2_9BACI|nr:GtrA family protein [Neobacillus thermocopriae]NEX77488.1 GtrA family protein [Neobacillus thermocopriae]
MLNKEIMNYLIFGVLTTIVNIALFWVMVSYFGWNYQIATVFAWVLSVAFAFITNKRFVFNSQSFAWSVIEKELIQFYFFRVISLLFDLFLMYLFIELVHVGEIYAKVIANIVVILINYMASKWIIFGKARNSSS